MTHKELTLNLEGTGQSLVMEGDPNKGAATLRDLDFELTQEKFEGTYGRELKETPSERILKTSAQNEKKEEHEESFDEKDEFDEGEGAHSPSANGSILKSEEDQKMLHDKIDKIQGKIRQLKLERILSSP